MPALSAWVGAKERKRDDGPCGIFDMHASGQRYVVDDGARSKLCDLRPADGVRCTPIEGEYLGWRFGYRVGEF
jgi:hypothetical protein